ncbi:MAG: class I SAM-dependent methyltransferase [Candidatus Sungbacteria bacterium]|uniref:Class I SAM-dependent methyltransferase n=1 Tax=Candidatus Sungiibacteriota bacterium TaxID=2750080 RepID=A0A932VSC9_9BACT|nr:class I SAM-dependent methyltransferase [Candidatus Sungbacteria bacterium]
MSSIVSFLKKLPVDVGQAEKKHDSAGKRIAFSLVPDGTGKTALDIGCRDGYWSERLKKRGYAMSALDIEPLYADAVRHDVEQGLPYLDDSFDLVWCTEVVEHLRDPEILFEEIERVMRPGGIAVLTTPNSHWWFYGLVRLWGWTPQRLQNPDHKQFFDERRIRNLAKGYSLFGYFPYAVFFLRIRRLVGLLSPTFILVRRF